MPTAGQPRLLVEERRRKILDLVEKQARVTVDELVNRFGVSAVTVRGDLDALSQSGAVIRSHGGALKRVGALQDVPINVKETLHHGEKVRIGHAAAQMIRDNEIVMLDSGTTTAEVARHIKFLKLKSLTEADFIRILKEPKNALIKQYQALLDTEGIKLTFTEDAIEELAAFAARPDERPGGFVEDLNGFARPGDRSAGGRREHDLLVREQAHGARRKSQTLHVGGGPECGDGVARLDSLLGSLAGISRRAGRSAGLKDHVAACGQAGDRTARGRRARSCTVGRRWSPGAHFRSCLVGDRAGRTGARVRTLLSARRKGDLDAALARRSSSRAIGLQRRLVGRERSRGRHARDAGQAGQRDKCHGGLCRREKSERTKYLVT